MNKRRNKPPKNDYSTIDEYKAYLKGFAADVKFKGANIAFATSIAHSKGFSEKDGVMTVNGGATITYGDTVNEPTVTINTTIASNKLGSYTVVFKYSADNGVTWKDSIAELLNNTPVDAERLAQEVAYFAEKSCIDEELVRLQSHFEQFYTIADQKGSIGRKLDFLIQEMNRETNTIGSKANDLEIGRLVVEMKSELEKVREQIQNIE